MGSDVRVRFAPSPTGHLHIGNVRTALLNWLFAKHSNGTFVLRIEDTDPERSKDEYIGLIYDDLRWMKLDWDEGPDVGGLYGPYRQSERFDIYRRYAKKLLDTGKAYHCYCTPDELDTMRKEALARNESANYPGTCRNLTDEQKAAFEKEGRKPVVRFRVPEGDVKFNDLVKGEIQFDTSNIGDFVIMRQEGIPMYNFAAVVDDHLMKISHVIRGDDHVSNTPRQILMFNALEVPLPQFAHIPMILGPDRQRLSKRHGATSLDEYRDNGYLAETLVNFLSLLSWSSQSGDEILSVERLIEEFDFGRVSKSAAVFNPDKLNWMNGQYIRNTETATLTKLVLPMFQQAGYDISNKERIHQIVTVLQEKVEFLEQMVGHAKIFFQDHISITDPEARAIIHKDSAQKVLWSFLRELRSIGQLDIDIFRDIMKHVQKETGIMGKDLWMPVRVALTGEIHGPELPSVISLLGKEQCEKFVQEIVGDYR
ncbi:glutamate--tRNA ligase [candidate division KSB1 bacterium]|nr:glutamate--tRNA ligase [candidate division KSB1 bacterium]